MYKLVLTSLTILLILSHNSIYSKFVAEVEDVLQLFKVKHAAFDEGLHHVHLNEPLVNSGDRYIGGVIKSLGFECIFGINKASSYKSMTLFSLSAYDPATNSSLEPTFSVNLIQSGKSTYFSMNFHNASLSWSRTLNGDKWNKILITFNRGIVKCWYNCYDFKEFNIELKELQYAYGRFIKRLPHNLDDAEGEFNDIYLKRMQLYAGTAQPDPYCLDIAKYN